jgi:hypothetical protein
MTSSIFEQVRVLLVDARLRRHGWARFEAGTRRAALRIIRTRLNDPDGRPTTTG